MYMAEEVKRGRRPGISSTHEDILAATRQSLHEVGYEKTTLRRIADMAGVTNSLLVHQFGSKDQLLATALIEPEGFRNLFKVLKRFPKATWGRLVAEGIRRGSIRSRGASSNLEIAMRAATHSAFSSDFIRKWHEEDTIVQLRELGLTHPELRARALLSVAFGNVFLNEIVHIDEVPRASRKAQTKMQAAVFQQILAGDLE